jgi:hypothetical protein
MHHWTKRLFAIAAPLLLTSCLWGPGKFTSDLTLRKDGSFTLDYRGEIVLQIPEDVAKVEPWRADMAHCYVGAGEADSATKVNVYSKDSSGRIVEQTPKERPCTAAETARLKSDYEKREADKAAQKKKQSEEMAKLFGLPGLDDASSRAFAAKLMKYAGWRSVTYRGNGVFDVDYHMEGRATQDFVFPALPGGAGPLMERMAAAGAAGDTKTSMVSHAQGRFTVVTDGEILTNNSEDGPSPSPIGRQLHWDVGPASNKIPETLVRL